MNKFGFSDEDWNAAKEEMRDILIERVRTGPTISYSELAGSVNSIDFEPDSFAFHHMLGEISTDEHSEGRGMLSVVVVHKDGEIQPGFGFFELAKKLGRDTSDTLKCWSKELQRVSLYWTVTVHIPKEWLRGKVEIRVNEPEEKVQKRRNKRQTPKPNDELILSAKEAESMFGESMKPGDEIWFFSSPPEFWQSLCGSSGYVLVREGEVIDSFTTVIS